MELAPCPLHILTYELRTVVSHSCSGCGRGRMPRPALGNPQSNCVIQEAVVCWEEPRTQGPGELVSK